MIDRIGVEVYIEWLAQQWESDARNSGLEIPGPVFDWFCDALAGGGIDLDGDISPNVVVRKLAEGDYGPIEQYDDEMGDVLKAGRELCAEGDGGKEPDEEELRQYILAHREECMGRSGLEGYIEFWYRDDASDYGISIVLGLGV